MSATYDPLGRLEAHASQPYDHPAVSISGMERYWQSIYAEPARSLSDRSLAWEHGEAETAIKACESNLAAAVHRVKELSGGAGTWQTDNERIEAAAERDAHFARLSRLVGRRDALAAEMARRAKS